MKGEQLNDFSVATVWLARGDHSFLLDLWRERVDYPALRYAVGRLREKYPNATLLIEDKGSDTSLPNSNENCHPSVSWIKSRLRAARANGTAGGVPLGYDAVDKKLTINPVEAKTVRTIFQRYLELKCLRRLKDDLDSRGIVSKRRKTRKGSKAGGVRLTYGPLAHLLKNLKPQLR